MIFSGFNLLHFRSPDSPSLTRTNPATKTRVNHLREISPDSHAWKMQVATISRDSAASFNGGFLSTFGKLNTQNARLDY
jgi:hypothetical protein